VDALDAENVERGLGRVKPDFVINCIGIVKQRDEAKAAIPSILVNALFPHRLADMCGDIGARLIHL
jgi:dTDP-4-dehydrorhamnose reductase